MLVVNWFVKSYVTIIIFLLNRRMPRSNSIMTVRKKEAAEDKTERKVQEAEEHREKHKLVIKIE